MTPTPEQIHAMSAGPAMNAAVAEKLFSLEVVGICSNDYDCIFSPERGTNLRPVYLAGCCCDLVGDGEKEGEAEDKVRWGHYSFCLKVVPDYSTDIAAAFEMEAEIEGRELA